MDNHRDPGDLVVSGVHRPLRWKPDSYLDRGRRNRSGLQPGFRSARLSQNATARRHAGKLSKSGECVSLRSSPSAAAVIDVSRAVLQELEVHYEHNNVGAN